MTSAARLSRSIFALSLLGLLSACAGSKVLKEAEAIELSSPLAVSGDENVVATLDWIVVKDGPGTWASNAFWDEYRLRVENHSASPIIVRQVQVVDSLGMTQVPAADRDALLYASKLVEKRYSEQALDIQPGAGTAGMVATGVAGGALALTALGYASATTFVSATGLGSLGGAPVLTATAVAIPVLVVGGIVHSSNNARVSEEIALRQSAMPVEIGPGELREVRVFFPIAPSPRAVRVIYEANHGAELLEIDTTEVLAGLHYGDPDAPSRRPREGSL